MEKKIFAESEKGIAYSILEDINAGEKFSIAGITLNYMRNGQIWIEMPDGEGGEFAREKVAEAIKAFYDKNF